MGLGVGTYAATPPPAFITASAWPAGRSSPSPRTSSIAAATTCSTLSRLPPVCARSAPAFSSPSASNCAPTSAVSVNCGHSALTRTPLEACKCSRLRENSTTAALVAEYTGACGMGKTPPADATLTTEVVFVASPGAADSVSTMASTASLVPCTTAFRFTFTTCLQSARSPMPALLKQACMLPKRRTCAANAEANAPASPTSATRTSATQLGFARDTSARVSATPSGETSTRVKPEAPSRARRTHSPRPMP